MRKSILPRLALVPVTVVLTILSLEVLFRVALPSWSWLWPQSFLTVTSDGVLSGVPHYRGRFAGIFGDFDAPVSFDKRGFSNPDSADPGAPLAFVGDSFCMGLGISPQETFAHKVAQGLGVATYNFCLPAANLLDDLRIVQSWMPKRTMGLTVLTVTFENDVLAYPAPDSSGTSATAQAVQKKGLSVWLMEHSAAFVVGVSLARQNAAIVALVRRLGLLSGIPAIATDASDPTAASLLLIHEIRRAAGGGPFLVLLVPPRPDQVLFVGYESFVQSLRQSGLEVLDPLEIAGLRITTLPHDGHWDAATHDAITQPLIERLRPMLVRLSEDR